MFTARYKLSVCNSAYCGYSYLKCYCIDNCPLVQCPISAVFDLFLSYIPAALKQKSAAVHFDIFRVHMKGSVTFISEM